MKKVILLESLENRREQIEKFKKLSEGKQWELVQMNNLPDVIEYIMDNEKALKKPDNIKDEEMDNMDLVDINSADIPFIIGDDIELDISYIMSEYLKLYTVAKENFNTQDDIPSAEYISEIIKVALKGKDAIPKFCTYASDSKAYCMQNGIPYFGKEGKEEAIIKYIEERIINIDKSEQK